MACTNCDGENITINSGCSPVDTRCVIYKTDGTPSNLNCIDPAIEPGTSLEDILEAINYKICDISDITILSCVKEKLNINPSTSVLPVSALLHSIQQYICNFQDVKVKSTPADTSAGYLYDKIATGDCLVKTVVTDGQGNQQIKISIDFPCVIQKIPTCFEIKPSECIVIDNTNNICVPQPTVPVIKRVGATLSGENCNGSLQWYNANDVLIATGNTPLLEANATYYAKCLTTCGLSTKSNNVIIPVINTYTYVRTSVFERNNCGVNSCNVSCTSSQVVFSKTYTSTVSQEVVNGIAENDMSFSVEGQSYANTVGICSCTDCNCTFPIYNNTVVINNATCDKSTVRANGQITITGISKADKFGWSVGQGSYSGINYENAISLNNVTQGNVETTPTTIKLKALSTETRIVFRIFNGSAVCYKDVVVTLTPPDCTKEQVNIVDTNVTCEVEELLCKNYTIVAGNTTANMWAKNCTTGAYEFVELAPNSTTQRCSTLKPQVSGGVVTENGVCK